MHYPPTNNELLEDSEFIKLMQKYNVKKCIYGHLHGVAHAQAIVGEREGIEFNLVSADYLNFDVKEV